MRRLGFGALAVALSIAALALSALRLPSRQIATTPAPQRSVDADAVAQHVAAAIRFPTISVSDDAPQPEAPAFDALHAWLLTSV